MKNTIYLGLDVHARHCVMGRMDTKGRRLGWKRFATSEAQLISHVKKVEARFKRLSLEEGTMAYWVSQTLSPHVQEILICDPRENALISSLFLFEWIRRPENRPIALNHRHPNQRHLLPNRKIEWKNQLDESSQSKLALRCSILIAGHWQLNMHC